MAEIMLPEFLNTEEKYNKMIHEVNTLHKFEEIFLKLLSDETLDMSNIMTLMKMIERDVILVNNLKDASSLMEMTETFIKYIMVKETDKNQNQEQPKKTKKPIKVVKDTYKLKKSSKEDSKNEKKMKPAVEEGIWECDC